MLSFATFESRHVCVFCHLCCAPQIVAVVYTYRRARKKVALNKAQTKMNTVKCLRFQGWPANCQCTSSESMISGFNPLAFHCLGYTFKWKHDTLKEDRLSKKRNTSAYYHLSLSTSASSASLIKKNKCKCSWDTEKFAKSRLKDKQARRMRTNQQVHRSVPSV